MNRKVATTLQSLTAGITRMGRWIEATPRAGLMFEAYSYLLVAFLLQWLFGGSAFEVFATLLLLAIFFRVPKPAQAE